MPQTNPPAPSGPMIESAAIEWRDGQPVSSAFGDVYFSRDNGLAESRYVFLEKNRLSERFAALASGDTFVVAETGFGTGLNFLATRQAWAQHAPADTTLHFVSVERFPLSLDDLQQALLLWPELKPLADDLIEHYPPLIRGPHRLVLDDGRVRLTLFFGDVIEAWTALQFKADAWFLDGFAPALNPDLWIDRVIQLIADHSVPGTTVATFTAVGAVRRELAAAGFEMTKARGFGRKRDMLTGTFQGLQPDATPGPLKATQKPIIIVGAGVAAALTARNLAERGFPVQVISAGIGPADGASGNPQAALYVKLAVDYGPESRLALHALLHAQRTYERYNTPHRGSDRAFWHPTGLLQLGTSEQERSRQKRFLDRHAYPASVLRPVSAKQASKLAGIPITHSGLWFPKSGWLEPTKVCAALLDHPGISCRYQSRVESIQRTAADRWQALLADGESLEATTLVVTGGHQVASLLPDDRTYRFKAIRGQVSQIPEHSVRPIETVICGKSYLNPAHQGLALTGATFDLNDDSPAVSITSHEENLDKLTGWLPAIWRQSAPPPRDLPGRVSFRCTTHDYQPVVGPVFQGEDGPDGLYVLTGLGSKGFAFAPLLAEWLTDVITNQPGCMESGLVERLSLQRCEIPE